MTAASPSPTTRSPRHPLWLTVTLALWLATVGNLPLWQHVELLMFINKRLNDDATVVVVKNG